MARWLALVLGGQLRIVVRFTIVGEKIAAIEAVADPDRIAQFDVVPLNA